MNGTGLRFVLCSLLGWSTMTERRRLRKLKRSMQENQNIAPRKYTIEIKVD